MEIVHPLQLIASSSRLVKDAEEVVPFVKMLAEQASGTECGLSYST